MFDYSDPYIQMLLQQQAMAGPGSMVPPADGFGLSTAGLLGSIWPGSGVPQSPATTAPGTPSPAAGGERDPKALKPGVAEAATGMGLLSQQPELPSPVPLPRSTAPIFSALDIIRQLQQSGQIQRNASGPPWPWR